MQGFTLGRKRDNLHVNLDYPSKGTPGVDSGEVFLQSIDIHLRDVVGWTDIISQCKGELSGGELKVDGDLISLVPLPFERAGDITLSLQFSDGTVFAAKGGAVQVLQTGTRKFVEHFGGNP